MGANCFMDSKAVAKAGRMPVDMFYQAKVTQENMACVHIHIHILIEARFNFISHVLLMSGRGVRSEKILSLVTLRLLLV